MGPRRRARSPPAGPSAAGPAMCRLPASGAQRRQQARTPGMRQCAAWERRVGQPAPAERAPQGAQGRMPLHGAHRHPFIRLGLAAQPRQLSAPAATPPPRLPGLPPGPRPPALTRALALAVPGSDGHQVECVTHPLQVVLLQLEPVGGALGGLVRVCVRGQCRAVGAPGGRAGRGSQCRVWSRISAGAGGMQSADNSLQRHAHAGRGAARARGGLRGILAGRRRAGLSVGI